MSTNQYEDPGTRLSDEDRGAARAHLGSAIRELNELAQLVGKTLGNSASNDRALTRVVIETNMAVDEPIDVTVSTFCHGHECLGVYDAVKGICRPCTPDDHACD
jgi:hypothetical protein